METVRFEDSINLPESGKRFADVLKDIRGQHQVKGIVFICQVHQVLALNVLAKLTRLNVFPEVRVTVTGQLLEQFPERPYQPGFINLEILKFGFVH